MAPSSAARAVHRTVALLCLAAIVWAFGASLALMLLPTSTSVSAYSTGASPGVVTTSVETHSMVDAPAPIAATMVVAAIVAVLVLWRALMRFGSPPRRLLLIAGWAMLVFVFLGMMTIGLFYLPVPVLLLAAARRRAKLA